MDSRCVLAFRLTKWFIGFELGYYLISLTLGGIDIRQVNAEKISLLKLPIRASNGKDSTVSCQGLNLCSYGWKRSFSTLWSR